VVAGGECVTDARRDITAVRAMLAAELLIPGEAGLMVAALCDHLEGCLSSQGGRDAMTNEPHTSPDAEIQSLGRCMVELEPMPDAARRRMLWYLVAKYISFPAAEAVEKVAIHTRKDGVK
jgi:hypothetical protein